MLLHFKYEPYFTVYLFIKELLDAFEISYVELASHHIQIDGSTNEKTVCKLKHILSKYDIELLGCPKEKLIQDIKTAITEMINQNSTENISDYISKKMSYSYDHLAKIFKENTSHTIEGYLILQRIERVKHLAVTENLSLTEINYRLNYSSVSHLSRQFKRSTGINFQDFMRIMRKRQELLFFENQ